MDKTKGNDEVRRKRKKNTKFSNLFYPAIAVELFKKKKRKQRKTDKADLKKS